MKDETGKIIFDADEQLEVNRVVEERLNRERSKYVDYEDLKGTLDELNALGYQGSAKEVKEAIRAVKEQTNKQKELEELQNQARTQGASTELLAEIKEAKRLAKEANDKLAQYEAKEQVKIQEAEAKKLADEAWKVQEVEFTSKYDNETLVALNNDEDFMEYAEGKKGTLLEIYEKYLAYAEKHKINSTSKALSKVNRSTGTGKENSSSSGNHGLTAEQTATVDEWNKKARSPREKITYQEYANGLRR